MYTEKIPLHKTETVPINAQAGNEWELICYECSFRARYTQARKNGENTLEILDVGDQQARHMGNHGSARLDTHPGNERLIPKRNDEETWLTPELRQKLSQILQGLD